MFSVIKHESIKNANILKGKAMYFNIVFIAGKYNVHLAADMKSRLDVVLFFIHVFCLKPASKWNTNTPYRSRRNTFNVFPPVVLHLFYYTEVRLGNR